MPSTLSLQRRGEDSGTLSDHMGRQGVILISVISAGPLPYLFTLAPIGFGVLALLALYGLVMSFRIPAIESLIADFAQSASGHGLDYLLFL